MGRRRHGRGEEPLSLEGLELVFTCETKEGVVIAKGSNPRKYKRTVNKKVGEKIL